MQTGEFRSGLSKVNAREYYAVISPIILFQNILLPVFAHIGCVQFTHPVKNLCQLFCIVVPVNNS